MNNISNTTTDIITEWIFYEQIVYSVIVALIGIPGNILIILVFAYSKEKSTTDYMVFSMAISDLLGSSVCTTFNILQNIQVIWARIQALWFCRANDMFAISTAVISIWLLCATAVDRYMKICRPHSLVFTVSRAKSACVIIFTFVPPTIIALFFDATYDTSTGICLLVIEKENEWLFVVIKVSCIISLMVTAVAYILVAFVLYKRLKDKIWRRRAIQPKETGKVLYRIRPVSCKIDDCNNKACGRKLGDEPDSKVPKSVPTVANQGVEIQEAPKASCSYVNEKSKAGNRKAEMVKDLRQEQKHVNRTTIIMFLITAINVSTFVAFEIAERLTEDSINNPGTSHLAVGYFIKTSYMVNYITNPILYISMSSKFREGARKLLKRR